MAVSRSAHLKLPRHGEQQPSFAALKAKRQRVQLSYLMIW